MDDDGGTQVSLITVFVYLYLGILVEQTINDF
jgi:hypothetical protein